MNNLEKICQEIRSWYPEETISKDELIDAARRLISFLKIGAELAQLTKGETLENTQK